MCRTSVSAGFVFCAFLAFSDLCSAQTKSFTGVVNATLPAFTISVHYEDSDEANGWKVIDRIQVYSNHKLIQTISYSVDDENKPVFNPSWKDLSVTLQDIDCDGNKDLLVRVLVGVHGDAWYRLYRYRLATYRFVEYTKFRDLPFVSANCRTDVVKTYGNGGLAGCIYSSDLYHWVRGELMPLRMEEQAPGPGNDFTRTITAWRKGKKSETSRVIPGPDCHAP